MYILNYFTWNKIKDYNFVTRELTEIELLQYNYIVRTYPKRFFKYSYCQNNCGSIVYKYQTDFTNPNFRKTYLFAKAS